MSDQAARLRTLRLVQGGTGGPGETRTMAAARRPGPRAAAEEPPGRPRTRSIAVTSGKGGVGKTSVAANLAIAFARRGKKVLLVDGDLSLANVDLLLGVVPQKNLGDVVLGRASIDEVLLSTADGVRLLPAGSGVEELADLDDFRREKLLRELSRIEQGSEIIVLDTGSGIGRQTIHFARAADQIVVVTTPEPTAFSDAYATLKVLSRGRMRNRPGLLVNMTTTVEEGRETERRIRMVAERFLGLCPEYLGHVFLDGAVGRAVRMQEPLLRAFPQSPAAACIENLASRLLVVPGAPDPREEDFEAPEDGFFLKVANGDE